MSTKALFFPALLLSMLVMSCRTTAQTQPTPPEPAPSSPSNATANPGTLEIQGTGRMKVQPDQTTVMVQVSSSNSEAGRAVQQVTERVEQLLKKLQSAGFKKEEIKTSQFFLNENNQWVNDRMVRQGYTASQTMEVKFGLDPARMTKLTTAFSDIPEGVTFHFAFGLTDKLRQQVKEELIRKALQDAREKAAIIARAANIRLGTIRKIDYSQQGNRPYGPVMEMAADARASYKEAPFPQTEIQELEMQDQIMVIWSLEQ